jgi:MFS family permease
MFGRKRTLLIAFGLCCIPASFLQLFAPNMGALAFGRMWNYFGIGLTQQVVPLYVTEMTPARYRATLTGFSGGFNLLVGVFTTIIMWGCAKINNDHQWKIPLAIQAGLPILLFCATLTLQESTTWLISKGRIDEATALHRNLRPAGMEDLVEAEMAAMVLSYGEQEKVANVSIKEIFGRRHLKRTIAASLVGCLSACSGYSLTATYGVVILIQ